MRNDHLQCYLSHTGEFDEEGRKIFDSIFEAGSATSFTRINLTKNITTTYDLEGGKRNERRTNTNVSVESAQRIG